jgi:hypothetical protein
MIPAVAAAAAAKVAGPLIGGYGNSQDISTGMADYNNDANAGRSLLEVGKQAATEAYSPYTQAGATGVSGYTSAITGRTQATNPTLSNTSASDVSQYLDPSAAYTSDQARKQSQAAGIATGAVGGGLEKAISNNANQAAQTNWNNAYNQMLSTNNQNFQQQQQQYTNNNDYQQSQISNYGNLANVGLSAVNSNQQLQSGYNQAENQDWMHQGENSQSAWNNLGANFNKTAGDTANAIGGGISSVWPATGGK